MIDNYPDTLALVTIMRSNPWRVPWGDTRDAMYQAAWVPHSCHDGIYEAWPYTEYEDKFLARRLVSTDVTIDMTVFGASETTLVNAVVCIESGGTGKTMDIWIAQALDHHGPVNHDRNEVQDGNDGVEISLAPGECATVTEIFTLNQASLDSPENVKFFAWAQDTTWVFNSQYFLNGTTWLSAYESEIFQGAKALQPFEGVFVDGFESTGTTAWSTTNP